MPSHTGIKIHSLPNRTGKTIAMEKAIREYTKLNPDAVICRMSGGGYRIEKPVREVPILKLEEKQNETD